MKENIILHWIICCVSCVCPRCLCSTFFRLREVADVEYHIWSAGLYVFVIRFFLLSATDAIWLRQHAARFFLSPTSHFKPFSAAPTPFETTEATALTTASRTRVIAPSAIDPAGVSQPCTMRWFQVRACSHHSLSTSCVTLHYSDAARESRIASELLPTPLSALGSHDNETLHTYVGVRVMNYFIFANKMWVFVFPYQPMGIGFVFLPTVCMTAPSLASINLRRRWTNTHTHATHRQENMTSKSLKHTHNKYGKIEKNKNRGEWTKSNP